MNIVDIVIILLVLAMAITGAKRGVIKELVTTIGFVLVVVLAFYLKNPIADFLSLHLPFFTFGGKVGEVTSFNIMLYQGIAFLLVIIFLEVILQALIKVSGFIEKILRITIILGIPSKILGFIVGLIEGFIIVFIVLFFFHQPQFNIDIINDSKFTKPILNSTPILSNIASGMVEAIDDSYALIKDYNDEKIDDNTLDLKSIEVMLKHKVVTPSYVRKLVEANKINIVGIDSLINKYEE